MGEFVPKRLWGPSLVEFPMLLCGSLVRGGVSGGRGGRSGSCDRSGDRGSGGRSLRDLAARS